MSQGLLVAPKRTVSVVAVRPNSESVVFATGESPSASACSTHGELEAARVSGVAIEPWDVT